MRTIKFRGKTLSGEWAYGSLIKLDIGYIILTNEVTETSDESDERNAVIFSADEIAAVNPETVGQFTGLLDKNGTEVYEGDVVRFTYSYEKRGYYTIVSNTYIGIITLNKFYHSCIMNGKDEYHIENIRNGEVIGNIHDNPELLKGGKQ